MTEKRDELKTFILHFNHNGKVKKEMVQARNPTHAENLARAKNGKEGQSYKHIQTFHEDVAANHAGGDAAGETKIAGLDNNPPVKKKKTLKQILRRAPPNIGH